MRVYLDSSIAVRVILNEPNPLKEWSRVSEGFSSRLLRLECLRAIYRGQINGRLAGDDVAMALADYHRLAALIGMIPVTELLLRQAEQPFPTTLGSLDAIHLVTALEWREQHGDDFAFATHDTQLALAAKAHGFTVIGV